MCDPRLISVRCSVFLCNRLQSLQAYDMLCILKSKFRPYPLKCRTSVWLNNLKLLWRMKLRILEYFFSCSDFQLQFLSHITGSLALALCWHADTLDDLYWGMILPRSDDGVYPVSVFEKRVKFLLQFNPCMFVYCSSWTSERDLVPAAATCGLPSSGETLNTLNQFIIAE